MDVNALLSSLTSIGAIGKALLDERDSQKLATLKGDLSNKIIEAQSQFMQLHSTVIEQQRFILTLEERIRELEATSAEKARYQLTKLGTQREFFAYALRPDSELPQGTGEVAHFLCQPCFDAGKKVVLTGNGEGYWKCPVCNLGAQTTPVARVRFTTGSRYDLDDF
ncbi:TPA: hypothetical protein ACX381_001486 [Klebsiella pneumoniae]|uniref:hypothetical protein n=1 Tax=Klebsiella michiganensis TaxID=1134687 RepID=UPI000FDB43B7|nr:hypothetical protein [Klebsiella michiganensis]HBC7499301.1 hypothetical protein [Klebsiella oxytoca]HDS8137069.1 hypothetical protein [Klebsiella pneumoniae subsp. pneumoniae]MCK2103165.1 hypothetical protein [Klebsiella michiganensis]HDX4349773.1 hypothetical protein [Klebsiella michiganensis]HDX8858255.1 hypothetical protein [Klebsiella michiganensis]